MEEGTVKIAFRVYAVHATDPGRFVALLHSRAGHRLELHNLSSLDLQHFAQFDHLKQLEPVPTEFVIAPLASRSTTPATDQFSMPSRTVDATAADEKTDQS